MEMTETAMERYHSIDETAEITRCSPHSIRHWVKTGKLRKTKAGGRVLIAESDLRAFLTESTKGGKPKRAWPECLEESNNRKNPRPKVRKHSRRAR